MKLATGQAAVVDCSAAAPATLGAQAARTERGRCAVSGASCTTNTPQYQLHREAPAKCQKLPRKHRIRRVLGAKAASSERGRGGSGTTSPPAMIDGHDFGFRAVLAASGSSSETINMCASRDADVDGPLLPDLMQQVSYQAAALR